MADLSMSSRRVVAPMDANFGKDGFVHVSLILAPPVGARTVSLQLTVRRVRDHRRLVSRKVHTGPIDRPPA
jgi:hypothetical protein